MGMVMGLLHIFYGEMPEAIFNTAVFFKNSYDDAWIVDEFSRQMIADVDKSEVLGTGVIDSSVLGKIAPERLSGGVKTLMLVKFMPDRVFNVSTCGNHCAKWLLKIAEDEERTVNLRNIMDFGDDPFSIHVLNTDQVVHSMRELLPIAIQYV